MAAKRRKGILLRIEKGALVAADAASLRELRERGYKVGDVLVADLVLPRNPEFNGLAHKLGALKGSGALYVRRGLVLRPLIAGGGQEGGLRSGTEAMPQIAAFAAAARERSAHLAENAARMAALRERLIAGVRVELDGRAYDGSLSGQLNGVQKMLTRHDEEEL